jgi:hypothetical protein
MNIVWSATCMPGHMRRPNPKGILKSLSTLPFQFPAGLCGVKNREGLNVSGSSNRFGSMTRTLDRSVRCHRICSNLIKVIETYSMLLNTLAPLGILYPLYISALVVACGTPSGTTGRHLVNAIATVIMETGSGKTRGRT